MGFRNESCVEIGRENVVLGMFTPGCHVALEDVHHTLSNLEFTFLASVLASSFFRVMTKGVVAFHATPVTNHHLCRNMPTFHRTHHRLEKVVECVQSHLQAQEKQVGGIPMS